MSFGRMNCISWSVLDMYDLLCGPISVNELKDVFFSIKTNKCLGHDEINFSVIGNCFGNLRLINLKLNNTELSNYRPISVLPCFSKLLVRVMYDSLYK